VGWKKHEVGNWTDISGKKKKKRSTGMTGIGKNRRTEVRPGRSQGKNGLGRLTKQRGKQKPVKGAQGGTEWVRKKTMVKKTNEGYLSKN